MRNIKFRIWSKLHKKWYTNSILMAYDGLPFAHFVKVDDDGKAVEHQVFNAENLDLVVQQSTGLTDQNGQEIYEGDIFKDDYWWVGEATVEYANGMFGFEGGESGKLDFRPIIECEHIEIIGNIFEGVDK